MDRDCHALPTSGGSGRIRLYMAAISFNSFSSLAWLASGRVVTSIMVSAFSPSRRFYHKGFVPLLDRLFTFRLVLSRGSKGYETVLAEL